VTSVAIDPLFVDVYPGDRACNWAQYIAAGPPWHGAIFKLSQGTRYEYAVWAAHQRELFRNSERFGDDLFDGYYHYLDFAAPGDLQAEWFWGQMGKIGGERSGTLWAMVDAERGGQQIELTKVLVEHRIGGFAERYRQLSGRTATLYGGELLRSIGASGRYGCGRSAVALYGPELHAARETTAGFLARTGTDLAHLALWQYRGTGSQVKGPKGYPLTAPGCGEVDISALVLAGGLTTLCATLWAELPA